MPVNSTKLTLQAVVYIALVVTYGAWRGPFASQIMTADAATDAGVPPTPLTVQHPSDSMSIRLPITELGQPVVKEGTNAILPPQKEAFGSILMYHYVRVVDPNMDPLGYRLSVTSQDLDREISAMKMAGYRSISMDDYIAGKGDAKSVVMTFDDGYEDFYTDAYPILQRYGWSATLYIITGKVGMKSYLTWPQIRQLHVAGFEMGAHTVDHNDLSKQTPNAQYHEIFDSKAMLETQIGKTINTFCYPSGRYDAVTESLVEQAGFTSATTTHPGLASKLQYDPFQLPRIRIEPPLSPSGLLRELDK